MSTLSLRIYYEDTDFSGFVYHARYLHFFERGRTEALRALGIDQLVMFEAPEPSSFVVRRMEIDYRSPARMDDQVEVKTSVKNVGAASITMAQALMRGDMLLSLVKVEIAYLVSGKPRKMPADLRLKLQTLIKD